MKKPWYKKWWGVIIAVLFFYIFIPYYAWTKSNWSQGVKIGVTIFCILILIGGLASGDTAPTEENNANRTTEQIEEVDETFESDAIQVESEEAIEDLKTQADSINGFKDTIEYLDGVLTITTCANFAECSETNSSSEESYISYFATGDKIEKMFSGGVPKLLVDFRFVNQVDYNLKFQGRTYSTSMTPESLTSYLGYDLDTLEPNWSTFFDDYSYNDANRADFFENFVTVSELEPIVISGVGDTLTTEVTIVNSYALVKANHTGGSNFVISAIPTNGSDSLLVNEIGNYSGVTLLENPEAQNYMFEVTADGNWTIEITQPTGTDINAPRELQGSGDSVTLLNLPQGNNRITANHTGSRNFVVSVKDPNNSWDFDSLVVNEIGNYSGSNLYKKDSAGLVYLEVIADGSWTINIE